MEPLAASLHASGADASAFEAVFSANFDRLVAQTVGQVWDSEIAVDIAAETLAEGFIQRTRFRGTTDAEVTGWLNGIARRKIASFYRKAAVERRALSKLGIDPPQLTEDEHRQVLARIDAPAMRDVIMRGLEALSEPQRVALTMRVVDEVPYPTLAERLDITEEAARARVARALRTLRRELRNHGTLLKEAP